MSSDTPTLRPWYRAAHDLDRVVAGLAHDRRLWVAVVAHTLTYGSHFPKPCVLIGLVLCQSDFTGFFIGAAVDGVDVMRDFFATLVIGYFRPGGHAVLTGLTFCHGLGVMSFEQGPIIICKDSRDSKIDDDHSRFHDAHLFAH